MHHVASQIHIFKEFLYFYFSVMKIVKQKDRGLRAATRPTETRAKCSLSPATMRDSCTAVSVIRQLMSGKMEQWFKYACNCILSKFLFVFFHLNDFILLTI